MMSKEQFEQFNVGSNDEVLMMSKEQFEQFNVGSNDEQGAI